MQSDLRAKLDVLRAIKRHGFFAPLVVGVTSGWVQRVLRVVRTRAGLRLRESVHPAPGPIRGAQPFGLESGCTALDRRSRARATTRPRSSGYVMSAFRVVRAAMSEIRTATAATRAVAAT